jgi:type VI secretion system protein ImpM
MPDRALTTMPRPALPKDARAGFYGKLPARGDFVRENLPRDFTDAWDGWWQRGLAETQAAAGDAWRNSWLEAPVWRFVLPPGLCGRNGVIGVWMPSVDKAGRYFPLTIAAVAPIDWLPLADAMAPFLAAAEQAGRDALEFNLAPDALLARVEAGFNSDDALSESQTHAPGAVRWWTEGGTRVAARAELGSALPTGTAFATLIDDAWGAAGPDEPAAEPA